MSYQGNQYQRKERSGPSSSSAGGTTFKIAEDADNEYDMCSLKWREQINNHREREGQSQTTQQKKSDVGGYTEVGGLGKELIKLMKKATYEKKASAGKRKPLGNVNNGRKMLESRAAAKKELQKIHGNLQQHEMC